MASANAGQRGIDLEIRRGTTEILAAAEFRLLMR